MSLQDYGKGVIPGTHGEARRADSVSHRRQVHFQDVFLRQEFYRRDTENFSGPYYKLATHAQQVKVLSPRGRIHDYLVNAFCVDLSICVFIDPFELVEVDS